MKNQAICAAVLAAALPLASVAQVPAPRSGKEVVQTVCFRCHEAPNSPAPKVGDKEAWVPRLSKGIDNLVSQAIHGHGGMPPRGGKADLTDTEVRSAILYMFNPAAPPADAPKVAAGKPQPDKQCVASNGLRICMGMASADQMRAYPPNSPEAKMHGGVPDGEGFQHINVFVSDAASNAPVAGASVKMEIEQLGISNETKALEPISIGGTGSYGAYVRLVPTGIYTFKVNVRKPGSGVTVEATFHPPPG